MSAGRTQCSPGAEGQSLGSMCICRNMDGIIMHMCVSLYMCSHMAWMGKGEQKLSPPGAPLFSILCLGAPIGHAVPGAGAKITPPIDFAI